MNICTVEVTIVLVILIVIVCIIHVCYHQTKKKLAGMYVSICQMNAFVFSIFLKVHSNEFGRSFENQQGRYTHTIAFFNVTSFDLNHTPGAAGEGFIDQNYYLLYMGSSLFTCIKRGGKNNFQLTTLYSNINLNTNVSINFY